MTESVGGRVIEHLKTAKQLAAIWIGGAMLIVGATIGYSTAAARTWVQTVERAVETPDNPETIRLRKQVQVLKDLIVRYQVELAYVDEQLAKGGER